MAKLLLREEVLRPEFAVWVSKQEKVLLEQKYKIVVLMEIITMM